MMMFFKRSMFVPSITLSLLPLFSLADDCRPVTWSNDENVARFAEMTGAPIVSESIDSSASKADSRIRILEVKPGELNCRAWARTHDEVNYYTCTEICNKYEITTDYFFSLNPTLETDCSNIQPRSRYCYDGCKSWMLVSTGRAPSSGH